MGSTVQDSPFFVQPFCVVSDSGTLPEESSFFASVGRPFPAVCIRTSTERPESLDKDCFALAGMIHLGRIMLNSGQWFSRMSTVLVWEIAAGGKTFAPA